MRPTSLQPSKLLQFFFLIFFAWNLIACSGRSFGSSDQNSFSFQEEPSYCSQVVTYTDSTVVKGKAQFLARQVSVSGLLGPMPAQAIRFAEVEVLDAAGIRVQCGTTDNLGQISVELPSTAGSYRLRVLSRALNTNYQASVLSGPYDNLPYSLEAPFSVDGVSKNISLPTMTASHEGNLLGGAFNILEQILKVNIYLRTNSLCPKQGGVCNEYTVAPPIRIFWRPGVSPYSYYGHPTSSISFFTKVDDPSVGIRRGLYIQGGIQGDVDCSDTDHFDNSVIIHEYGHFLEDAFAHSDSPGGSHNGNFMIDPRLAWSEGWANFIQAAILGRAEYQDTIGNIRCNGGTFLAVNLDLDVPQAGQDRMPTGTVVGEGIFREVSISRSLYHTLSSSTTAPTAGLGFPLIWKSFSDASLPFRGPSSHFRNGGLFFETLANLIQANDSGKLTSFQSVLSSEYQLANQTEYALPVTPQAGATCSYKITGVVDSTFMGDSYSNLLQSNDFFAYSYDGTSPEIELHYSGTNPSDLDIDIYRESHVYAVSGLVTSSRHAYPEVQGGGFETISLAGLPFGTYLINVKVNTRGLGNTATYFLSTPTGARLCP